MKQPFFSLALCCLATCFAMPILSAQDNQSAVQLGKKSETTHLLPSGDNCFLIVSEESFKVPGMTASTLTSRTLRKYDANLKALWKEPIVFKKPGPKFLEGQNVLVNSLTYTNPSDQTTFEYIMANGECLQIQPDGTTRDIIINMPKKEGRDKVAAAFVDANGFNILTMVGDETFPSGNFNWYTWSHDKLVQRKRTIMLPLPENTDKDNESGWRLNEITPSGLYFYYVSYKNKEKDKSRPILACHVIHVDQTGKPGSLINLDLGVKAYSLLPLGYAQEVYQDLVCVQPPLYNTGSNSGNGYTIPTDNAYLGIQIDESSGRIFTVMAQSDLPKAKMNLAGAVFFENVQFTTFDLEGKLISQSARQKLPSKKEYSSAAVHIELIPLPNEEGMICKLLEGDDGGAIWAVNNSGEVTQTLKPKPYKYKIMTSPYTDFVFSSGYFSLKDFSNSPYAKMEQSQVYQFYQKQTPKIKKHCFYISLKGTEVFATWDDDQNTLNLHAFNKN